MSRLASNVPKLRPVDAERMKCVARLCKVSSSCGASTTRMRGSGPLVAQLAEQSVELVERGEGDRDFAAMLLARAAVAQADLDGGREGVGELSFETKNVARLLTFRAQQRRLPCARRRRAGRRASRPRGRSCPWRRSRWPPGSALHHRAAAAPAHAPSRSRRRAAAAAPARSAAADAAGWSWRCASGRRRVAAASWVRPNSSVSRLTPRASSSGLRSSRCMFSISAIAAAASSATSRTSTGTRSSPARRAARTRRSPAMISKRSPAPPSMRRTSTGCITPCDLDALGQLVQAGLVHAGARLVAAGLQLLQRRAFAARRRSRRRRRRRFPNGRPEQGLEAEPEALGFLRRHRSIVLDRPSRSGSRGLPRRFAPAAVCFGRSPTRHRHEHPRFRRRPGRHDRPSDQ